MLILLLKAKFHYAVWFDRTSFERASNQRIMEFGFNASIVLRSVQKRHSGPFVATLIFCTQPRSPSKTSSIAPMMVKR